MDKNMVLKLNNIIKEATDSQYPIDEVFLNIVINLLVNKNIIDKKNYQYLIDNNNIEFIDFINFKKKTLNEVENIIEEIKLGELNFIAENYLNRKQKEITGSYYTPTYIVEFMVNDSLKNYITKSLNIKENTAVDLINKETTNCLEESIAEDILNLLENIKIIDIACGSGIFLIYMFQKLFRLRLIINKYLNKNIDDYKLKIEIIEKNIFGIDIQSFPLQVFLLSLIKDLSKYEDFNLENFKYNIYQQNSILGEAIYEIKGIQSVIKDKGFHIVIGNPPYIGEKGNREVFQEARKYDFGINYYEGKMDYFYYFIYRGVELLHKNGMLTFITTNYFITANGATKLRKYLYNSVNFKTIVNFNECEIFKSAKGQHNMIFTIGKGKQNNAEVNIKYFKNKKYTEDEIKTILTKSLYKMEGLSYYKLKSQNEIYGNNGNIIVLSHDGYGNIIKKIENQCDHYLGDLCNINQGIVSGADKVTVNMIETKFTNSDFRKFNYTLGEGIFVLEEKEVDSKDLLRCKALSPFYKNSDIKKYYTSVDTKKYILYLTDDNVLNKNFCEAIYNHLYKFKTILSMRRETRKGTRKWYALQWYREKKLFEKEKIVVPHRSLNNNFGYNEEPWYASADVYFITPKINEVNLKLLLGLLNSKVIYFWLYNMGKRKGNYLELYSKPLSQIPLKMKIPKNFQEEIIRIVEKILNITKNGYDYNRINYYQNIIDQYIYSIYQFNDEEIKLISELYKQMC